MKRWAILLYGILAYVAFFMVFLWSIAFIGNLYIPKTLDSLGDVSWKFAMLVNGGLLTVFAVQHSLMARPFFKNWLTRFVPQSAERSTYVMASNMALALLMLCWQPIGPELWRVTHPIAIGLIYALFFLGWGIVFVSTCLINHFDLFGLRQVWLQFQGKEYTNLKFTKPGFYKFVRHPLYVGWLTVMWSAPVMTLSHLVFAIGCTAYILAAIRWEEKDLIDALGVDYLRYRDEVPMLVPGLGSQLEESGVHTAHR